MILFRKCHKNNIKNEKKIRVINFRFQFVITCLICFAKKKGNDIRTILTPTHTPCWIVNFSFFLIFYFLQRWKYLCWLSQNSLQLVRVARGKHIFYVTFTEVHLVSLGQNEEGSRLRPSKINYSSPPPTKKTVLILTNQPQINLRQHSRALIFFRIH